jgi:hypothetical protein
MSDSNSLSFQPLYPAAYLERAPAQSKICASCAQDLPLGFFAKHVVGGKVYLNRRCHRCRAKPAHECPAIRGRRDLVRKAKGDRCNDCGSQFDPLCLGLVHARGEPTFSIPSMWRWVSTPRLVAELAKCDAVCLNCRRMRRAKKTHRLAQAQRALEDFKVGAPQPDAAVDTAAESGAKQA